MSADDICVTEEGMLDLELNSINNNALKSFIEKITVQTKILMTLIRNL